MTEIAAVILLVGGFLAGLWLGVQVRDCAWIGNAGEPKRVLRKGRFYKVVDIGSPWSWDMCKIHEEDNPGYDGQVTGPGED